MSRSWMLVLLIALLAGAGCATQAKFLDSKQDDAMQTAVARGRFELNCPAATGTILSRNVIQPRYQGPWVGAIQRAEYTIGVAGCDKRATYVVVCPEGGTGCFAAGPGPFHEGWR